MDQVIPVPESDVDDERILELYGRPPGTWLRMDFVSSLDGAATVDGKSEGLQPPGDTRVFDLLRRLADVVLVASGTVKAEGYGAMRLDDESVAWRRSRGMPDNPVFAIVTGRLDLDPASPVFTDAPVRPIIVTSASAPEAPRDVLGQVAELLIAGKDSVDLTRARELLGERGLPQILCEGGPSLFGSMIEAGAVDELCLSVDATLVGGDAPRIAHGSTASPTPMRLHHLLRQDDALFLSYRRPE